MRDDKKKLMEYHFPFYFARYHVLNDVKRPIHLLFNCSLRIIPSKKPPIKVLYMRLEIFSLSKFSLTSKFDCK